MLYIREVFFTFSVINIGKASTIPPVQMTIKVHLACHRDTLSGFATALYLRTAIIVSVKTDTLTLRVCTKGQKAHMNSGKYHLCLLIMGALVLFKILAGVIY